MPSPRDRRERDLHKERIANSLRADLKPSRRAPSRTRGAKVSQQRKPEVVETTPKRPWLLRWFLRLFWSGLAAGVAALVFLIVLYTQQPPVAELREVKLSQPLQILSSDGQLISQIGTIKRDPVEYQDIPSHLVYALLAAEDSRFFEHFGVDILGLARAVKELLLFEQRQSGGSTITMQVARNYYLTRKQTLWRKLNEILLALKIERELSKEEILELYVNKIFLRLSLLWLCRRRALLLQQRPSRARSSAAQYARRLAQSALGAQSSREPAARARAPRLDPAAHGRIGVR